MPAKNVAPVVEPDEDDEVVAEPTQVDSAAMLSQIQELQRRLDAMNAAQPKPEDPVAAAKVNLAAHVKARADMHPNHDFSEIVDAVAGLPDNPTVDDAEYVKELVTEFLTRYPHVEAAYLRDLAVDLKKAVLKNGS